MKGILGMEGYSHVKLTNKYQLLHRQGCCGRRGEGNKISHMELRICGARPKQVEQEQEEKMPNVPTTGKLVSGTEASVMTKAWRHF